MICSPSNFDQIPTSIFNELPVSNWESVFEFGTPIQIKAKKLSQYKYNSIENGFHRVEKYDMWTHMNQLFQIIPECILSIVGCWVWSLFYWWTSLLLAFLVLLVVTYYHWLWQKLLLQKNTQTALQREYSPTRPIYLLIKKSCWPFRKSLLFMLPALQLFSTFFLITLLAFCLNSEAGTEVNAEAAHSP